MFINIIIIIVYNSHIHNNYRLSRRLGLLLPKIYRKKSIFSYNNKKPINNLCK